MPKAVASPAFSHGSRAETRSRPRRIVNMLKGALSAELSFANGVVDFYAEQVGKPELAEVDLHKKRRNPAALGDYVNQVADAFLAAMSDGRLVPQVVNLSLLRPPKLGRQFKQREIHEFMESDSGYFGLVLAAYGRFLALPERYQDTQFGKRRLNLANKILSLGSGLFSEARALQKHFMDTFVTITGIENDLEVAVQSEMLWGDQVGIRVIYGDMLDDTVINAANMGPRDLDDDKYAERPFDLLVMRNFPIASGSGLWFDALSKYLPLLEHGAKVLLTVSKEGFSIASQRGLPEGYEISIGEINRARVLNHMLARLFVSREDAESINSEMLRANLEKGEPLRQVVKPTPYLTGQYERDHSIIIATKK